MGELQNDSIKTLRKPLSKLLKQLDIIIEAINIKFINENLNSYAALQELYYLSKEGNYATRIANYIRVGNSLRVGDNFHDFEAPDLKEKKIKISVYKGKYILLDFTQTYCAPCILAAEGLKKIAVQYPAQIQIITFYAETNKKVMQEGIDRDQFKWPTIWDGKGTYSDTF